MKLRDISFCFVLEKKEVCTRTNCFKILIISKEKDKKEFLILGKDITTEAWTSITKGSMIAVEKVQEISLEYFKSMRPDSHSHYIFEKEKQVHFKFINIESDTITTSRRSFLNTLDSNSILSLVTGNIIVNGSLFESVIPFNKDVDDSIISNILEDNLEKALVLELTKTLAERVGSSMNNDRDSNDESTVTEEDDNDKEEKVITTTKRESIKSNLKLYVSPKRRRRLQRSSKDKVQTYLT